MTKYASPCINICVLDDDLEPEICAGCYRTGDEITLWMSADDDYKKQVLELCEQRRDANMGVRFK